MQELISIKYDEQIEQKENERDYKTQLAERLSSDLQDDKIFGTLVLDLVKKYSEVKKLPDHTSVAMLGQFCPSIFQFLHSGTYLFSVRAD